MLFTYKAITPAGKKVSNTIDASDRKAAMQLLRERGLRTLWLEEGVNIWQKDLQIGPPKKIKTKDYAVFCRQFSAIVNAGVSIIESLSILEQQTENSSLRKIIGDLGAEVRKGTSLSRAMKMHKELPNILVSMTEAGETSGNLDVVLEKLALHFEKSGVTQNKIKAAMMYPMIVSIVAVLAVFILIIFVVPAFSQTFIDLEIQLPAPTRMLIALSDFMQKWWYLIILAVVVLVILFKRWHSSTSGRYTFDKWILKLPVISNVTVKSAACSFTRTLSIMLSSGLPMLTALETVNNVIDNKFIDEKMEIVMDSVSKGDGISDPLEQISIFPPMVNHLVKIGESTGDMENMLDKLTDFYEDEVDVALKQLTTIIEPILLCFLAVLVGFIMISIMLPTFTMMDAV
ncbi:MAG: type II secretion system F family protein [Clostridiales bacterium]|jgi:type IV pilus assembly protein PilC|nr:type II secretion system F family protein [Clostridiales bacterium]